MGVIDVVVRGTTDSYVMMLVIASWNINIFFKIRASLFKAPVIRICLPQQARRDAISSSLEATHKPDFHRGCFEVFIELIVSTSYYVL